MTLVIYLRVLMCNAPCPIRLQNGTTYNSYLIFGEDSTALVDVSHEKFRTLYMATLREELARAGRQVDYIVVSHTEPDHSGARCASCFLR